MKNVSGVDVAQGSALKIQKVNKVNLEVGINLPLSQHKNINLKNLKVIGKYHH